MRGISSPQSPAITENHRTCNGVVGGQAQMIVQESARGMTQVTGSEKVPTTPTTPTARRQDLDQNVHRPELHARSHNMFRPKYARYLKAAQGEVGYVNRLRELLANSRQISSFENVVTSTFQAIRKLHTQKDTPAKSSEQLSNCNFANFLVCRTNGYHLTAMFQIKTSISENHFQI